MDHGIVVFNGCGVSPVRIAREVAERGFESLFFPEHTHVPVASRRPDGRSAEGYAHSYDPFVALAAAAAVSATLTIGTAVCLVTQRDPITTAKAVASLDQLADGRFVFGVGAGWNRAGAGQPRHRPAHPDGAPGRPGPRDAGRLGRGRGRVPR
ncbi:LLM class flavin-dependent oxidoreductase [Streptacidiphilus neutrinimicus]|uniref:LLM class flavin-dependent oxidoreductase n=1 Tax=Streptacidiphilus neutrinimicus TaxID=105420 RepID=UPI000B0FA4F0|nr:LLM class flavin-dependent oxidoreductase [Streptacidiphilus neutrinimicus]